MSGNSVVSNYGGRQPNNTSYIKQFSSATTGYASWIYKTITYYTFIQFHNKSYILKNIFNYILGFNNESC